MSNKKNQVDYFLHQIQRLNLGALTGWLLWPLARQRLLQRTWKIYFINPSPNSTVIKPLSRQVNTMILQINSSMHNLIQAKFKINSMNLKLNFKLGLDLLTWAITQVIVNTLSQDDVYGSTTFFYYWNAKYWCWGYIIIRKLSLLYITMGLTDDDDLINYLKNCQPSLQYRHTN